MSRYTDISPLSRLLMRVDATADGAEQADGIPTGFPSLDDRLGGGLRRGDLVILGGDVGAGKSALALAIALRARAAGHAVSYFSSEMSADRVLERVLAIEGRVRIDDLRRGSVSDEMRASLGAAALRLREQLPRIEEAQGPGVSAIEMALQRDSLVVIDSLRGLTGGDTPHHESLAATITELKQCALRLNVALLVTAHLSGRASGTGDTRPSADELGGLGVIHQAADVVLGIYREEMYATGDANEGATELLILKNRHGATGYVDLYFYKQWLRFEDMVDPDR